MFHLLNFQKYINDSAKKNMLGVAVTYPEFFWAYWYMYWDLDFNKSIGEHTIRQTEKSYSSMKLLFDAKQPNRVIK